MPVTVRTLTIAETADHLGVAPARVRALIASGALRPTPGDLGVLPAAQVADITRRGVVRSTDVAAVEGALDRALRRRLPGLIDAGLAAALAPLAEEVASAFADVELGVTRLADANERARVAEQALAASRTEVADLQRRVETLESRGLFRRRRPSGVATA